MNPEKYLFQNYVHQIHGKHDKNFVMLEYFQRCVYTVVTVSLIIACNVQVIKSYNFISFFNHTLRPKSIGPICLL